MNKSVMPKYTDGKERHIVLFGFWFNANSDDLTLIAATHFNQDPRNNALTTGIKLKLPIKLNPAFHQFHQTTPLLTPDPDEQKAYFSKYLQTRILVPNRFYQHLDTPHPLPE